MEKEFKSLEMQNMIKAIDFNEKILASKVLKGFLIYRIKQDKILITENIIKQKVGKNLERFYFKAIHRKFRRLQKRKYIKGIVKGYRQERRMRRIVEEWKKAVDLTKFETEEMNY